MKTMTYEEIKAAIEENYNRIKANRIRGGRSEREAERGAYDIALGMAKSFKIMELISDEQLLDILGEL